MKVNKKTLSKLLMLTAALSLVTIPTVAVLTSCSSSDDNDENKPKPDTKIIDTKNVTFNFSTFMISQSWSDDSLRTLTMEQIATAINGATTQTLSTSFEGIDATIFTTATSNISAAVAAALNRTINITWKINDNYQFSDTTQTYVLSITVPAPGAIVIDTTNVAFNFTAFMDIQSWTDDSLKTISAADIAKAISDTPIATLSTCFMNIDVSTFIAATAQISANVISDQDKTINIVWTIKDKYQFNDATLSHNFETTVPGKYTVTLTWDQSAAPSSGAYTIKDDEQAKIAVCNSLTIEAPKSFDAHHNIVVLPVWMEELTNVHSVTLNIQGMAEINSGMLPKNITKLVINDDQLINFNESSKTQKTYSKLTNLDFKTAPKSLIKFNGALYPALTNLNLAGASKLTTFDVSHNNNIINVNLSRASSLTSINISNKTELTNLNIIGTTGLTNVDAFSNPKLVNLDASDSINLNKINVSHDTQLINLKTVAMEFANMDISYCGSLSSALSVDATGLTSLDFSSNIGLTNVKIINANNLAHLSIAHSLALVSLSIGNSQITSLDLSNNTALETLSIGSSNLTSLIVPQSTALTELSIGAGTNLATLDLSGNSGLTVLTILSDCDLTTLNLSTNVALTSLTINSDKLTSLDLPQTTTLTSMNINAKKLTSIDFSHNAALTSLDINAALATLDLSTNTNLTSLSINESKDSTALNSLSINAPKLVSLNLHNLSGLASLSIINANNLIELTMPNNSSHNNLTKLIIKGADKLASIADLEACRLTTLSIDAPKIDFSILNIDSSISINAPFITNMLIFVDTDNNVNLSLPNNLTVLQVNGGTYDQPRKVQSCVSFSHSTSLGWLGTDCNYYANVKSLDISNLPNLIFLDISNNDDLKAVIGLLGITHDITVQYNSGTTYDINALKSNSHITIKFNPY